MQTKRQKAAKFGKPKQILVWQMRPQKETAEKTKESSETKIIEQTY